jgi:hypothetical protein
MHPVACTNKVVKTVIRNDGFILSDLKCYLLVIFFLIVKEQCRMFV